MGLSKKDIGMIATLMKQSEGWKISKQSFGDAELEKALGFLTNVSGGAFGKVTKAYQKAYKSRLSIQKGTDGLKSMVTALRAGVGAFKTDATSLISAYEAAKKDDSEVKEGKSGKELNQIKLNVAAALKNVLEQESVALSTELEKTISDLGKVAI